MELTHNMVWIEIDPNHLIEKKVLAACFKPDAPKYKEKCYGYLHVYKDGVIACRDEAKVLYHCTHYIKLDEFDISAFQEEKPYDSTQDTKDHIAKVYKYLFAAAKDLVERAMVHDASKFSPKEKPYYDRLTPLLKNSTYMSEEYKGFLEQMQPALDHHYANNRHHPEWHFYGINGMNLIDLLEMFFDWKAASERHADGDIFRSIRVNSKRFGMTEQLVDIFEATVKYCEEQEIF